MKLYSRIAGKDENPHPRSSYEIMKNATSSSLLVRIFISVKNFALLGAVPAIFVKQVDEHLYLVENLRDGTVSQVYITHIRFIHGSSLETNANMSHVVTPKISMVVHRLTKLVDSDDGIKIRIRWRGFLEIVDTLEHLAQVYQYVPGLLLKLFSGKKILTNLNNRLHRAFHL